jgi:hypothetical protein
VAAGGLAAQPKFFFQLLSCDQFSIQFDVWGRLCTHFEVAKVRTFATVTQYFSVSTAASHIAPEGYHLLLYKDKGTKDITHILDLEDYGVTKKWGLLQRFQKEVQNNAMARLDAYAKKYVPRRTGAAGGSSGGGGSSGRS